MMLFDSGLGIELRKSIATELEALLSSEKNREYTLDIILAVPLPDSADVAGAKEASAHQDITAKYIGQIVGAQARAKHVHMAWHAFKSHPMVRDADVLRGTLIRYGVFRRLTLEATTQFETDALVGTLIFTDGLREECDPRIIHAFASEYKTRLPLGNGVRNKQRPLLESDSEETEPAYASSVTASPFRAMTADGWTEWATAQIRTIVEHFRNGRDQTGRQFANELISSQTQGTTDYTHVVKSLCNLSRQCFVAGRRDLSQEYLQRAFDFPTGIDSVAYAQLGNAFMAASQLDHAQMCYVKAQEMEFDLGRQQELAQKLIRVTVQRGKYHEALIEYGKLSYLWQSPQALTDRGTLLRKMGDLRGARISYARALDLDPKRHQAAAGLAEARKQAGKLEKAIKSYDLLLSGFGELDAQSRKIYQLATSYLFRLTGRMRKARHVLDDLIVGYPLDPDVNHQLGVLLTLTGERDEGLRRIQVARDGRESHQLANELLSLVVDGRPVVGDPISGLNQYMPEEQGLATCGMALTALKRESFDEVLALTESTSHVDKLHSDFALTLRYHAQRRVDMGFNYKAVQPLARIAKRGQRELKNAVLAIAEGRFSDALVHEDRMCLHLVT
ncbi:MAG: tetratricopeptide repeat protein [Fimbriimonadaceae bacterium]|nr:tetratricopeptide repeat protein [Fimbriimonadaceae bacterium]